MKNEVSDSRLVSFLKTHIIINYYVNYIIIYYIQEENEKRRLYIKTKPLFHKKYSSMFFVFLLFPLLFVFSFPIKDDDNQIMVIICADVESRC